MDIHDHTRQLVEEYFFTEPYYSLEFIINSIREAIDNKNPFSICRVGDAEAAILGQINVFSMKYIQDCWPQFFIDRNGFIKLPDLKLRDELFEAFKNADIISMFSLDKHKDAPNADTYKAHGEVMREALGYYNLIPKKYMYTLANVEMMKFPEWWKLLKDYKTAFVGVHMDKMKDILVNYDCNIVCSLELGNHNMIDDQIEQLMKYDFDWVVVSAGASAKVFIDKIKKLGKIGFDLGSAPSYFLGTVEGWNTDIAYDALKNS